MASDDAVYCPTVSPWPRRKYMVPPPPWTRRKHSNTTSYPCATLDPKKWESGTARRDCNATGVWSAVDTSNCVARPQPAQPAPLPPRCSNPDADVGAERSASCTDGKTGTRTLRCSVAGAWEEIHAACMVPKEETQPEAVLVQKEVSTPPEEPTLHVLPTAADKGPVTGPPAEVVASTAVAPGFLPDMESQGRIERASGPDLNEVLAIGVVALAAIVILKAASRKGR